MHRLILLLRITRTLMQPSVVGIFRTLLTLRMQRSPLDRVVIETECGADIAILFIIRHIC